MENNKEKSSYGPLFLNRSFTTHAAAAESNSPKLHLLLNDPSSLNRAAAVSKFYSSFDSVKGKVKKLCNLFESAKSSSNLVNPKVSLRPSKSIAHSSSFSLSFNNSLIRLPGTEDRIVVYLTSLRGIRRTYEDCYAVKMIFRGFRVWVDERDVSMDAAYKKELQSVLRQKTVSLPQVFIKGKYIGGADVIKSMYEVAELAKILDGFPKRQPGFVCQGCGDARFVLPMAASTKVLNLENPTQTGEWTVVLPRKGKHRRNSRKITTPKEQQQEQQSWVPTDLEVDPDRQAKLLHKMQVCMKKIESARFFLAFLDQMQSPKVLNHFHRVLGSELKLQMVIYGIGSIESHETPRLQLSLALLMKRKFSWIGDIEVFDPVLSATESQVLEALGCSVLSVNEQGRREAKKPTLFFMPHCEAELYNNLLQANRGVEALNQVALFGNSFETYEQHVSFKYYNQEVSFMDSSVAESVTHILAARRFTDEFRIETISDDYFAAFHDSSWHFFRLSCEKELQLH
ncbi:hypothetical protein V6N13_091550 [Hibiscus sabdariffa]|uniref:Protein SENSITIVITY TO RED LIGHT REDUCED 1 n=1 Tax=Hibiscus sabdariffa TaxID=183260 RepID=A0ABR2QE63_9ROSI